MDGLNLILSHSGFGLAVGVLYALLAGYFWFTRVRQKNLFIDSNDTLKSRAGLGFSGTERVVISLVVALHAAVLLAGLSEFARFGFAHALSAMMLCALIVYGFESLAYRLDGMLTLVLPVAAVAVILPMFFPGAVLSAEVGTSGARLILVLHIAVAMAAYGLLTIGAAHAMLMTVAERGLHARKGRGLQAQDTGRVLPPLLTLERLLFRFIWIGFGLLTLTLVSGVIFNEELFGRAARFNHKTVFAVLSWFIFAGLLAGRVIAGWRGRTAVKWTLAGYAVLLLAYVGSRFVLEVVLKR